MAPDIPNCNLDLLLCFTENATALRLAVVVSGFIVVLVLGCYSVSSMYAVLLTALLAAPFVCFQSLLDCASSLSLAVAGLTVSSPCNTMT